LEQVAQVLALLLLKAMQVTIQYLTRLLQPVVVAAVAEVLTALVETAAVLVAVVVQYLLLIHQ
jgi:hypothetical protein